MRHDDDIAIEVFAQLPNIEAARREIIDLMADLAKDDPRAEKLQSLILELDRLCHCIAELKDEPGED